MSEYAKVHVSMPRRFLRELDRTATEEHLSRSALIVEAARLYMKARVGRPRPRFFAASEMLRREFEGRPESEVGDRIDGAVRRVRGRRDG